VLERPDVDRKNRRATVRRTYVAGRGVIEFKGKTVGSIRSVPLLRVALDALDELPPRIDTRLLFPNSAGGIMTTDVVALARGLTAAQAIDELRAKKPDPQLTYYLYVVDGEGKLEGVLSLRDLVVAPPETKVSEIMDPHVLKVAAETPKEDVAALIAKYDLLAVPVVDARGRLRGTVTVDDVVELMLPRGWKKRSGRAIAR